MDLITVDISDLPSDIVVTPGSTAELIGPTVTIDDVAAPPTRSRTRS